MLHKLIKEKTFRPHNCDVCQGPPGRFYILSSASLPEILIREIVVKVKSGAVFLSSATVPSSLSTSLRFVLQSFVWVRGL